MTRVVVLAGGVGGAKFTLGVREALQRRGDPEPTVVVNTGDDLWLSGVRLQPDVNSIVYALAGQNDTVRGWGRAGDTERVNHELQQWGAGWPWFTLGDLDLGTHLARTGWLRDGLTPTQVIARMSERWPLGVHLLPMTDTEADTIVVLRDGSRMHFQEWWTRHRAALEPAWFENPGIESATPAPGVIEAIAEADVVLIAPSNPVVSIGPILAVPGIVEALQTARRVVGVSPIIGGRVVRGMADVCLAAIGVETSAAAVAAHYGARRRADDPAPRAAEAGPTVAADAVGPANADVAGSLTVADSASPVDGRAPVGGGAPSDGSDSAGGAARPEGSDASDGPAAGILDAWLLAEEDADSAETVAGLGIRPIVRPLWMTDVAASAAIVDAALAPVDG